MGWLISANLLMIISLAVACTQSETRKQAWSGTCASIGYNKECCPPWKNCTARDGNCTCNAQCHIHGKCCDDIFCPPNPSTCREYGIKECCKPGANCHASLYDINNVDTYCSCDNSCGKGNEPSCCVDVAKICPRNCSEAGWRDNCPCDKKPCYVEGGGCYCDEHCRRNGNCCPDKYPAAINPSSYWTNRLITLIQKQEQEPKESDKTTEQLLRNLVQDAEILNSYAQYAYARDVVLERADSQKMKSYTNEN